MCTYLRWLNIALGFAIGLKCVNRFRVNPPFLFFSIMFNIIDTSKIHNHLVSVLNVFVCVLDHIEYLGYKMTWICCWRLFPVVLGPNRLCRTLLSTALKSFESIISFLWYILLTKLKDMFWYYLLLKCKKFNTVPYLVLKFVI